MARFTVYKLTCPAGRSYIGCTSKPPEQRLREHRAARNSWPGDIRGSIGEAIRHNGGVDGFTLTAIATLGDPDDAAAVETMMIARHGTLAPLGYNIQRLSQFYLRRAA